MEKEQHENIYSRLIFLMDTVEHVDITGADEDQDTTYESIGRKIAIIEENTGKKAVKRRRIFLCNIAALIALVMLSSVVSYHLGQIDATSSLPVWIEMTSPKGVKAKVSLPDSTKVILNGGSSIRYLSSFENEKKVFLTGEAYFDVIKNEKKPLVVSTDNIVVSVLGTKFNLKSYGGEESTFLTLLEGSVVSRPKMGGGSEEIVKLIPNQQLILDNITNEFVKCNVEAHDFILWTTDILSFQNQLLPDIISELERHYNVEIKLKSCTSDEKYYARFKSNESIEDILSLLSYKRNWSYQKVGDGYVIFPQVIP